MTTTAYILLPGDPSVGIPDTQFSIEDLPPLDAYDGQREDFRTKLAAAFACIGEKPRVTFDDELPTTHPDPL